MPESHFVLDSDFFPVSEKKRKELTAALLWHVRQVFSPETWLTEFLEHLIKYVESDGYLKIAANPEFVKEIFDNSYHELAIAAHSALDITKRYPGLLDRVEWINMTTEENDEDMRQWRAAGQPASGKREKENAPPSTEEGV